MRPLILSFLLAFGLNAIAAPPATFVNPMRSILDTESYTGETHSADVNGDGRPDLVSFAWNSVRVLLGNGDGSFAPTLHSPSTGAFENRFTLGDVNGDGKPDIVTPHKNTYGIDMQLGNGDGTFAPVTTISSAWRSYVTAVGDFTGDGLADVLIDASASTSFTRGIVVFPGDGHGHFGAAIVTAHNYSVAEEIAVGDFNRDGRLDLVIGSGYNPAVLLGNGNGTFGSRTFLGAADRTTSGVAVADFNGDGLLDVAGASAIAFFELGNGDGTFHDGAQYPAATPGAHLAVADMNRDGKPDLIATQNLHTIVYASRPDGGYDVRTYRTGMGSNLMAADFDGDGIPDVVTAGSAVVSLAHGNGDGTLRAARAFPLPPIDPANDRSLALADATGDGKADVLTVAGNLLTVLPGSGDGAFGSPITLTMPFDYPRNDTYAFGDLNGDSKVDAVYLYSLFDAAVTVYLGNGDGTFRSNGSRTVPRDGQAKLADVTGDGKLDLIVLGNPVNVYPGNGDGSFAAPVASSVGAALNALVKDMDGDGRADLVRSDGQVCLSDATGAFRLGPKAPLFDPYDYAFPALTAVADLNGDGRPDVVGQSFQLLYICLANADGTFGARQALWFSRDGWLRDGIAADIDRDGHTDLVFGRLVLFGNGAGSFDRVEGMLIGDDSGAGLYRSPGTAVADLDGDGSPDIVDAASDGRVDVLLTNRAAARDLPVAVSITTPKTTVEYAQKVGFTATLTKTSTLFFEGFVRFDTQDGRVLGFSVTTPSSTTTLDAFSAFGLGSVSVRATALRNDLFASATSQPVSLDVQKATTKLSIYGNKNPIQRTETLIVVPEIQGTWAEPGFTPATGTVTVREGSTVLFTKPVEALTNNEVTLPIGSHTLTVEYPGDDHYRSSSATYTQVVTKPIPVVTLTGSPASPVAEGTVVTLTATLSFPDATGTVTVTDSTAQSYGTIGSAPVVNGKATISFPVSAIYHRLVATYSGDANYLDAKSPLTWYLGTRAFASGPGLNAFAVPGPRNAVVWTPLAGAVTYDVERSVAGGPFSLVYTSYGGDSYADLENIQPWTTYVYRVTGRDQAGNLSPSGLDAATVVFFSDPTLPGQLVRAQHLLELASAINAFRNAVHLSPFTFSVPPAQGGIVRAATLQELRVALRQARAALGQAAPFTDDPLAPGTVVRAVHIQQLRDAVQ